MYFNELRQPKLNSYYPVQYIQYDNKLYNIDDNVTFFQGNGQYEVLNYDDHFTGLNVSWYLDFSDRNGPSNVFIRGKVTAYTDSNASTLENVNSISIDDNGLMDDFR